MAELSTVQLIAGWFAILLLAVAIIGIIRLSSIPMVVLTASLLGIPIVAFATDVLSPQPPRSFEVIYLAAPFVGIALTAIVASVVTSLPRRRTRSFASMHRRTLITLLVWPSMVLAISAFVFVFEPAFALANVAANAAWFIVWIPRSLRKHQTLTSFEVAAPRERVFAFVSQPSNWPRYNLDLESSAARPSGPIAVGTEIVARRRLDYPGLRGPRMLLPAAVESVEVVTRLEPGRLLATRRVDGPDASAWIEMDELEGRTRVTTRSEILVGYRYAVVGGRLSLLKNRGQQLAKSRTVQERLRSLLENPLPAG
jgi:hypothetical protein